MPASLELLREAYTLSGGASNLEPKIIDRVLSELVRKWAPLRRALPRKTWMTDTYNFNKRTSYPKVQFTTEAPSTTDVAASNSTFSQVSFPVKHLQGQIDISTFAAQVATVNGNLFDLELAGLAKNMAYFEEQSHLWGSASATLNTKRPAWDGLDLLIATGNKVNGSGTALTLSLMDNAIDAVKGVAAQELGTDWFFLMSHKMQSRLNSLFTQQQRFNQNVITIFARDDYGNPGDVVGDNAVDAGLEVATYRGIPIVLSSFLSNNGQMGTISATGNTGSGSSLSTSATYYYVVEAVTRYGPTYASAEVSQAISGSGNNVVLSWSTPTPTDAFGNTIDILEYRIFRSTTSGAETLYAVTSAFDTSDTAVTGFTDTGLIQNPAVTSTLYATTVASSGSNAVSDGVTYPRGSSTTESIFLVPRDPDLIVVPEVNGYQVQMLAPVNARTRQFAMTADMTLALRAASYAAEIVNVKTA